MKGYRSQNGTKKEPRSCPDTKTTNHNGFSPTELCPLLLRRPGSPHSKQRIAFPSRFSIKFRPEPQSRKYRTRPRGSRISGKPSPTPPNPTPPAAPQGSPHSKQQKPSRAAFQSIDSRPRPGGTATRPPWFPFWEAHPQPKPHPPLLRRPGSPHSKQRKPFRAAFQHKLPPHLSPESTVPQLPPGPFWERGHPSPQPKPPLLRRPGSPHSKQRKPFRSRFSIKFPLRPNRKYSLALSSGPFGNAPRSAQPHAGPEHSEVSATGHVPV